MRSTGLALTCAGGTRMASATRRTPGARSAFANPGSRRLRRRWTNTSPSIVSLDALLSQHVSTCTSWPRSLRARDIVDVYEAMPPNAVSGGYWWDNKRMRTLPPLGASERSTVPVLASGRMRVFLASCEDHEAAWTNQRDSLVKLAQLADPQQH